MTPNHDTATRFATELRDGYIAEDGERYEVSRPYDEKNLAISYLDLLERMHRAAERGEAAMERVGRMELKLADFPPFTYAGPPPNGKWFRYDYETQRWVGGGAGRMTKHKAIFAAWVAFCGGLAGLMVALSIRALIRLGEPDPRPGVLFVAHPSDDSRECVFVTDAADAHSNGVYCRPRDWRIVGSGSAGR